MLLMNCFASLLGLVTGQHTKYINHEYLTTAQIKHIYKNVLPYEKGVDAAE